MNKEQMTKYSLYFLKSSLYSTIYTFSYAFMLPTGMRKFLEKDRSYREYGDSLVKRIEGGEGDESMKKTVKLGDGFGVFAGNALAALYGIFAFYQIDAGETAKEKLLPLGIWALTNCFSLGWEIARLFNKNKTKK